MRAPFDDFGSAIVAANAAVSTTAIATFKPGANRAGARRR